MDPRLFVPAAGAPGAPKASSKVSARFRDNENDPVIASIAAKLEAEAVALRPPVAVNPALQRHGR